MKTIGNRLKEARNGRNLSVNDVALALEVSASTYREWEYGRSIRGEPYEKLASLFHVSLVWLITGKSNDIEIELKKIQDSLERIKERL